ncbi:unnamed protein product [Staurois parvus]|uniref:Uncharacterized protein n=1 Tax=Staurois parvus TaxID=386267 RepID=A0ABN9CQQ5_9NEOB|nr:unnamed protein product [Staurois parvus]
MDWQRGVEDTKWKTVEGLSERGGGHWLEASEEIGREGWRTLVGGQWRDWQIGVEDTEWRPWRDWQRGVEDTEWRPVEGLAERGGGH